jgi:TetR/AcrR family transcriptional regulator
VATRLVSKLHRDGAVRGQRAEAGMARRRALDYDDKRKAILDRAAELFAGHGYDGASISMIAEACGVSKALLYHYYGDKAELLFDVIRNHLDELIEAVEEVARETASEPAEERLSALSAALLDAYRDADAEHQVQINNLRLLPQEKQEALRALERRLVAVFAEAVASAVPRLSDRPALVKPVTMSLFGMLNWSYLWFRDGGALTRADYARLVTRLVVDGGDALPAAFPATPAGGRRSQAAE